MRLELHDSADNVVKIDDIEVATELEIGGVRFRNRAIDRYNRDGAVPTGDGSASERDLTLKFGHSEKAGPNADAQYWDLLNRIAGMFSIRENGPFYLVDVDNSRRAQVLLTRHDDRHRTGTVWRFGMNTLRFLWVSAVWEDTSETVDTTPTGGLGNGETYLVNNEGYLRTFAIFEVSPFSETIEQFTLRNQTNGAACRITASNLVPGTTMKINSVDGTIKLVSGGNEFESSAALADRFGFIPLEPGLNTIAYQSAFGDVEIVTRWRQRYYF